MKMLILFQFLFVVTVCGQQTFEINYRYTIDFKYCAEIENIIVAEDSIIQKPSAKEQNDIANFVAASNEKVKNRKVIVYSTSSSNFDFPLSVEENNYLQFRVDTVFSDDGKGNLISELVRLDSDFSKTAYICFQQEWYYNTNKNKMEVVVNGYSPVFDISELENSKHPSLMPMYLFKQHSRCLFSKNRKENGR